MLDDLFINDSTQLTSVGDIKLSDDSDNWPQEIQGHIIESIPLLSQVPGNLSMDMVDEDKGFMKGSYIVPTPDGEAITIPVLVRGGRLFPPDVYIYKKKFYPVDEEYMVSIMTDPSLGESIEEPQDIPETEDNLGGQIQAPTSYINSYTTPIKTSSVNLKIMEGLKKDPALLCKVANNKKLKKKLDKIMDTPDEAIKKEKKKLEKSIKNDVVTLKCSGLYSIKSAAVIDGSIHTKDDEADFNELAKWAKTSGLNMNRIISELKEYGMAFAWDRMANCKTAANKNIDAPGKYTCYSDGKTKNVAVIGRVKLASGDSLLAVDENKNYTLQKNIFGRPCNNVKVAGVNEQPVAGDVFTFKTGAGYYAEPVKIARAIVFNSEEAGQGFTITGNNISDNSPVSCVFLKNAGIKNPVRVRNTPKGSYALKYASAWLLPAETQVLKLNNNIKLASNVKDVQDFSRLKGKHSHIAKLAFSNYDKGNVTVSVNDGKVERLDAAYATSLLKQAGINNPLPVLLSMSKLDKNIVGDEVYQKVASTYVPGTVEDAYVPDYSIPKIAEFDTGNFPKIDPIVCLKVASAIDNEEAMTDVLSMAYADPTNLAIYKENLPSLKDTEEVLSRLLITTRLGQQALEERDVRSALFQLHDIIKIIEREVQ